MFAREFEIRLVTSNRAEFHLREGDAVTEAEIEGELLAIVHAIDPALDDSTGRLRAGALALARTTEILIVGPDSNGYHHLAGISCAPQHVAALSEFAASKGFRISGAV